jgi:hypothetical protein
MAAYFPAAFLSLLQKHPADGRLKYLKPREKNLLSSTNFFLEISFPVMQIAKDFFNRREKD